MTLFMMVRSIAVSIVVIISVTITTAAYLLASLSVIRVFIIIHPFS